MKATKRVKAGTSKAKAAERRVAFVEAYIANGGNASQAAITAGFSAKTASSKGEQVLREVEVSAAIAQRAKELAKKYGLTADLAARSIHQELSFDPLKLFQKDGITPKTMNQIDEDTRMALSGVELGEKGAVKFKWNGRSAARADLMKHLGMFKEDNTQKGDAAIVALIAAVGINAGKFTVKP